MVQRSTDRHGARNRPALQGSATPVVRYRRQRHDFNFVVSADIIAHVSDQRRKTFTRCASFAAHAILASPWTRSLPCWVYGGAIARASKEVKRLALKHIAELDSKIEELKSMRTALADLASHCHGDARPECPILDDLGRLPPSE